MSKTFPEGFNLDTAIELVKLSEATYTQYRAFKANEEWEQPDNYRIELEFKAAYEKNSPPLGFIASKNNNLYIAWRGTEGIAEWIEDEKYSQINCPFIKSDEHIKTEHGFTQLYTSASDSIKSPQDKVLSWLKINNLDQYETIYITGHSLGAALAVLNTIDLVINLDLKSKVKLYSFAGPRVGNKHFKEFYDKQNIPTYRIVNKHDKVPHLPPLLIPPYHYEHINSQVEISFVNLISVISDHAIQGYRDTLESLHATAKI